MQTPSAFYAFDPENSLNCNTSFLLKSHLKWFLKKIILEKYNLPIFWCETYIFLPAAAKLLQSFLTLCDPIDSSPPGSPIPEILQARTLEWVAIAFSNAWKWNVKVKSLSRVWLLVTPWTAAYQAPPSMGFSRHEYWSGVSLPSPFSCLFGPYSISCSFFSFIDIYFLSLLLFFALSMSLHFNQNLKKWNDYK